jgi:hypothetical protein
MDVSASSALDYLRPRCCSSLERGLVVSRRRHGFNSFLQGVRGISTSSKAETIILQSSSDHDKTFTQITQSQNPQNQLSFHNFPLFTPDQHKKETPNVQIQLKEKRSVVVRHLMEEKKILCSLSFQKVQAMGIVGYSRRF